MDRGSTSSRSLVEQAAIGAEERPYRQRVCRVSIGGLAGFRSDVYELPEDPKGVVAAHVVGGARSLIMTLHAPWGNMSKS